MSTIILATIIFGTAGTIIYKQMIKKESCGDCHTNGCAVKNNAK